MIITKDDKTYFLPDDKIKYDEEDLELYDMVLARERKKEIRIELQDLVLPDRIELVEWAKENHPDFVKKAELVTEREEIKAKQ